MAGKISVGCSRHKRPRHLKSCVGNTDPSGQNWSNILCWDDMSPTCRQHFRPTSIEGQARHASTPTFCLFLWEEKLVVSLIATHLDIIDWVGKVFFSLSMYNWTPGHCYAGQAPKGTFFWVGKVSSIGYVLGGTPTVWAGGIFLRQRKKSSSSPHEQLFIDLEK